MEEEQILSPEVSKKSLSDQTNESDSLLVQAKGIWPLIIAVFLIVGYLIVSTILLFISYKFGRL